MPIMNCTSDGKPGYKWGGHGHCYTYTPGNERSRKSARKKAEKQGAAAHASGWTGKNGGGEQMEEKCEECDIDLKALPDVSPNEDQQTYVSRCIKFETEHSSGRDPEQIQRMCYEKYRSATGGKTPPGVKKDITIEQLEVELAEIKKAFEELKKAQS